MAHIDVNDVDRALTINIVLLLVDIRRSRKTSRLVGNFLEASDNVLGATCSDCVQTRLRSSTDK